MHLYLFVWQKTGILDEAVEEEILCLTPGLEMSTLVVVFFCAGLKMVCLIPKAIPEQAINRLHFTTLLNDIPFD